MELKSQSQLNQSSKANDKIIKKREHGLNNIRVSRHHRLRWTYKRNAKTWEPRSQVRRLSPRLRTDIHAGRAKGSQPVSKVHLRELSPGGTIRVLPEATDGKVVGTMTRLLKMISNLGIVPQSGSTQMLLTPRGKGPERLSHIQHKGPVTAQWADDSIDDIWRLAGKVTADSELAFGSPYVGNGRDMPAQLTPWSTTRVCSRSKAVAPRGEQTRVHKEIPKVDVPPVSNQRGLRK